MPFSADFDDVYQIGIKEACNAAGAYCERVDEQIFHESILDRVYNQIAKADLIVADMSGRNPNVFYEVGYAHALGKRTILLTKHTDDIPFDLKHFPHIVYGNRIRDLRDNLKSRVEYFVKNPIQRLGDSTIDIEIFIGDQSLSSGEVVHEYPSSDIFPNALFTIHNASGSTFEPGAFTIGAITSGDFPYARQERVSSTRLPNGDYLHMFPDFPTLFPKAFTSFHIALESRARGPAIGEEMQLTVRVFTATGTRDYQMRMRRATAED